MNAEFANAPYAFFWSFLETFGRVGTKLDEVPKPAANCGRAADLSQELQSNT